MQLYGLCVNFVCIFTKRWLFVSLPVELNWLVKKRTESVSLLLSALFRLENLIQWCWTRTQETAKGSALLFSWISTSENKRELKLLLRCFSIHSSWGNVHENQRENWCAYYSNEARVKHVLCYGATQRRFVAKAWNCVQPLIKFMLLVCCIKRCVTIQY